MSARSCGHRRGAAAQEQDEGRKDELLEALVDRLRAEGVPQGTWLVDIARVRSSLRDADGLLLKLQTAILNGLPPLGG